MPHFCRVECGPTRRGWSRAGRPLTLVIAGWLLAAATSLGQAPGDRSGSPAVVAEPIHLVDDGVRIGDLQPRGDAPPEGVTATPPGRPDAGPAGPLRISRPSAPTPEGLPRPEPSKTGYLVRTIVGSLAIVLGVFFLLVWFFKRGQPKSTQRLPNSVLEVLGRAPLNGKQQLQLLRLGNKLLLVSVTPQGAETLTEITEALEVDRLSALCQQSQPNSISTSFRQVMEQFGREPASGFLGSQRRQTASARRSPESPET